ncbi:acyl carrier protein [Labrenzia sp. EL_126]|nr:acyl carrier protein [Labrenzia sp. EL_126]
MITEKQIYQFLEDDLGIEIEDITSETLLFSSGIIDSFALVTLMVLLETNGGFRINPADVNLDNMDSIARMIDFVERASA